MTLKFEAFKDKTTQLDKTFTMFFTFSLVINLLITALGLQAYLLILPLSVSYIWVLIVYSIQGAMKFSHLPERSIIERARGLTYVFCLITCFILNALALYFPSAVVIVAVLLSVTILSLFIVKGLPRTILSDFTKDFNAEQRQILIKSLGYAAMTCMWLSWLIITLNYVTFASGELWAKLVPSVGFLIFIFVIYKRELRSQEYAKILSQSLINSDWLKKFEKRCKSERQKSKRLKKSA